MQLGTAHRLLNSDINSFVIKAILCDIRDPVVAYSDEVADGREICLYMKAIKEIFQLLRSSVPMLML